MEASNHSSFTKVGFPTVETSASLLECYPPMLGGEVTETVGCTVGHDGSGSPGQPNAKQMARGRLGPIDQLKALLQPRKALKSSETTEDHILSILALRRARTEIFGTTLFAEPAWDALLELYAASLGARRMSVADIAIAIHVPESTAARWVAALVDHGLVEFHAGTEEFGASRLGLTEKGASQIKQLADRWRSAFLSI